MSIASQVVILFLVVLVGALCRKLRFFTDETILGVTQLVVNITLPVLTVYNMQRPFETRVLINFLLTLGLSIVAILAALLGSLFLFRNRPHDKRAVLANLEGFSNSGFMGYPIILAVNPDWMIYAVAYNIAFVFVTWTVGVSLFQGRQNVSLKRVLLNPNVIAAFLGFAVFCLNITLPDILSQTMSLIGGLTTPLSMLLIGTRISGIRLSELRDKDYHITAALRLIVLPLVFPALLAAMLMVFAVASRELVTSLLLSPAGTQTVAVFIWRQFEQGSVGQGMAMASLTLLTGLVLMLTALALMQRSTRG